LKFELEDSLVKINGEGTNSLGNFSMIGYMNFYRNKGNFYFIEFFLNII